MKSVNLSKKAPVGLSGLQLFLSSEKIWGIFFPRNCYHTCFCEFLRVVWAGLPKMHSTCPEKQCEKKNFLKKKEFLINFFGLWAKQNSQFCGKSSSQIVKTAFYVSGSFLWGEIGCLQENFFFVNFSPIFRIIHKKDRELRRQVFAMFLKLHSTRPEDHLQENFLFANFINLKVFQTLSGKKIGFITENCRQVCQSCVLRVDRKIVIKNSSVKGSLWKLFSNIERNCLGVLWICLDRFLETAFSVSSVNFWGIHFLRK